MFVTLQDLACARRDFNLSRGLGQTPAPATAPLPASATAPPSITSIQPVSGGVGTTVAIYGSNLLGVTVVSFNGVPASSFTVVSPSQVNAVVAAGTTTGPVSVTTPGGSASYSPFTFFTPSTVPAGALAQQAVDDVLRPLGLPSDVPTVYTLDRLYAIQNAAITRGVDPAQAVSLVRQEVFRRVLQADPSPQAGLTDLAQRLTGTTAYSTQAPPPVYAAPAPPAYYQPPFQPSYQVPQQGAPTQQPPTQTSEEGPTPRRRARKTAAPEERHGPRSGMPGWAPYAAAAVGGAVLVVLLTRK